MNMQLKIKRRTTIIRNESLPTFFLCWSETSTVCNEYNSPTTIDPLYSLKVFQANCMDQESGKSWNFRMSFWDLYCYKQRKWRNMAVKICPLVRKKKRKEQKKWSSYSKSLKQKLIHSDKLTTSDNMHQCCTK